MLGQPFGHLFGGPPPARLDLLQGDHGAWNPLRQFFLGQVKRFPSPL
jgi:hypothetical protein